ncbi:oligoribonuclease [Actinopolymorpha sp. B11F2]|uniref:oligoribonuclease n=1 Tax=Actinopolymorpha sp. B11F2 TaxID=3160862 RepID=UPI0032E4CC45
MYDRLVWIDCEMTGLDLRADALVEVAALVTDGNLNVLGEGVDLVVKPPQQAVDQMRDIVRTMHTASGLLDELAGGVSLAEAEERVLSYVRTYAPESNKAPLAGNTVATDRAFLARDMPALESHLHYRIVDVSSIKELVRRWYPRVYFASPDKTGNHRALADIRESIDELRYYRAAVFVPAPGPDSAAAKTIAEEILGKPTGGTQPAPPVSAATEPVPAEAPDEPSRATPARPDSPGPQTRAEGT